MLMHKGTVPLETPRLALRRFRPEDTPSVYRNWASNPQVTRYMRWSPHQSVQETGQVVESWVKHYSQPSFYLWLIELRETGTPIGALEATITSENDACAELGYCLGRYWWGGGLMSEAVAAAIRFLFQEVGLNRIEACHSVRNPASGRVMEKCGMTFEGMARQKYYSPTEGFQDCRTYAILRGDWTEYLQISQQFHTQN